MKKLISALFALIFLISSCAAPTLAAGLDNFKKNSSSVTRFADVSPSHWAYDSIYDCVSYGLMNGMSEDGFEPDGSLTVMQAIVMADRVNEIYETGRSTLTNGDPWYAPYLEYAVRHGIANENEYADTNAPATRAQMAHIFYNALPGGAYSTINGVEFSDIPDVYASSPYAAEVLALYRAGILNGSDAAGTFYPDSRITRAEAAAIITRAVDTGSRVVRGAEAPASLEYTGEPYVVINGGVPDLDAGGKDARTPFELYSELDALGRCGAAYANVCPELMPEEERGGIGMVRPTGWHTARYDDLITDKYLYNRCHLIAFMLAGENANEKNLITGTRYLNIEGMLPFENRVARYVRETGNHVLYRVTPDFRGDELVARGVIMEALSVEDRGAGVKFAVYCFNVQPGVIIDYATGESERDPDYVKPDAAAASDTGNAQSGASEEKPSVGETATDADYIVNTGSGKFHLPTCPGVKTMAEKNKLEFHGTREEAIAAGYAPCGTCKP